MFAAAASMAIVAVGAEPAPPNSLFALVDDLDGRGSLKATPRVGLAVAKSSRSTGKRGEQPRRLDWAVGGVSAQGLWN